MSEKIQNLLFLNNIKGLGPKTILQLLGKFDTTEKILSQDFDSLIKFGVRKSIALEIIKQDFSKANEQLEKANEKNINLISLEHPLYPWQLKNIYDPPVILYLMGNKDVISTLQIAIVGSRDCTSSGVKAADYFAKNLAKSNITVTSGLARGIDFYAHKACIDVKGKTVGVLGTSIDQIYPKNHNYLVSSILDNGGCILSELPFSTPPKAQNFPRRNRIISGLSKGVIVVEAKERSGSLVTARMALEQGRDVFAIPGNIFNKESAGTNKLLQSGAKLISTIDDVLEELDFKIEKKISAIKMFDSERQYKKKIELELEKLDDDSRRILNLLNTETSETISYDFIIGSTKMSPNKLSAVLMNLELEGLIIKRPGGYAKAG